MNSDLAGQVLREYQSSCRPEADPGLEALRAAILFEDVFGVTIPDAEIDPAAFAGPSAVAALIGRLQGTP